jgi:hypothetical protein
MNCPECGSRERPASTPRTVYECGSSDYDQRPGTFKQGDGCGVDLTVDYTIHKEEVEDLEKKLKAANKLLKKAELFYQHIMEDMDIGKNEEDYEEILNYNIYS